MTRVDCVHYNGECQTYLVCPVQSEASEHKDAQARASNRLSKCENEYNAAYDAYTAALAGGDWTAVRLTKMRLNAATAARQSALVHAQRLGAL